MRVLLVMDPYIRVPPDHYGGIERVVADVADGLAASGHDVTLWAAPGSKVRGRVVAFGREGEWTRWSNARNMLTLTARFMSGAHRFDVIHNFGRLAYLSSILPRDVPKVQTYMRRVNPRNMRIARRADEMRDSIRASRSCGSVGRPMSLIGEGLDGATRTGSLRAGGLIAPVTVVSGRALSAVERCSSNACRRRIWSSFCSYCSWSSNWRLEIRSI